jgi:hypothetical protein
MKIHPVKTDFFRWTEGRTDRRDEANGRFSKFCERVPKSFFLNAHILATRVKLLETKLILTVFKNSGRTAQETHSLSATQTNKLMLYSKIITGCCEIHIKSHKKIVGSVHNFRILTW